MGRDRRPVRGWPSSGIATTGTPRRRLRHAARRCTSSRIQAALGPDGPDVGLASTVLRELRMVKDADEIALLRAGRAGRRSGRRRRSPPAGSSGGPRRTSRARSASGSSPRATRRRVRDRRLGAELGIAAPRGVRPGDPGRRADRARHRRHARRLRLGHHADAVGDRRRRPKRSGRARSGTCSASSTRPRPRRPRRSGPGVACEAVDAAARGRRSTPRATASAFFHRTGHGIGLEGHEDPYLVAGNAVPLRAGMAFSVEPGIYLAGRVRRADRGHRRLRRRRSDRAQRGAARAAVVDG